MFERDRHAEYNNLLHNSICFNLQVIFIIKFQLRHVSINIHYNIEYKFISCFQISGFKEHIQTGVIEQNKKQIQLYDLKLVIYIYISFASFIFYYYKNSEHHQLYILVFFCI